MVTLKLDLQDLNYDYYVRDVVIKKDVASRLLGSKVQNFILFTVDFTTRDSFSLRNYSLVWEHQRL